MPAPDLKLDFTQIRILAGKEFWDRLRNCQGATTATALSFAPRCRSVHAGR